MERVDSKIHEKYTALKKRKLLDEGLQPMQEKKVEEICKVFKDWVRDLEKENVELNKKLVEKQDELEKARQGFLEDIHTRDSEIQRLKHLLNEKAEKSNSKTETPLSHSKVKRVQLSENAPHSSPAEAEKSNSKTKTPVSHGKVKRVQLSENAPHSSPAEAEKSNSKSKTPVSHGKVKRVQLSENAPHSSPAEESTRQICISGNRTNEILSAHMLCSLLQSLVRMKISVNEETEIFSISFSHEASGYSFTLTWLENSDEWSYKLSSLGTLERIAAEWMSQDIRFSMKMCRMFFQRIANIITKG